MRGDIFQLRHPRDSQGHEQAGDRYAVVLQSDDLLLSTVLVAPTSTSARAASFRPEISLADTKTRILVEQTAVVDPEKRFGKFAGRLSEYDLEAVDRALLAVFGVSA